MNPGMLPRMRSTFPLLAVLLWGLLLVPALCTAGELAHPCECGETIQCDHEEECGEDPCADLAVIVQPDPDLGDLPPAVVTHPRAALAVVATEPPVQTAAPVPTEPSFPSGTHPLRN